MRWLVERTRDVFDDVGAEGLHVLPCGALWFTDEDERLVITYASGQWITVVPDEDAAS